MPRSLTWRLTLLYSGGVFITLVLASLAAYFILSASFDDEDADFLSSRAAVANAILSGDGAWRDALTIEAALGTAAHRYALNYVRVIDDRGSAAVETPGMARLLPSPLFAAAPSGTPREITGPVDGRPYLTLETMVPSRPGWRIEAALDVSQEARLDKHVLILFGSLLTASIALALAAGWLVSRRGLAPLSRIAQTARRIDVANLDERLGETAWPDELAGLARTFDGMLARLRGSFQRLSDFSANLAHELRTPINNLMGEAEVALGQERSAEDYRQILISAREEYGRLAHLVDNLLFLARADSALAAARRQEIDGRAALDTVCAYYAALAEDRDVTLACRGAARLDADLALLQRAVANLVSNALRHSPPGGRVTVGIAASEAGVEIIVSDDGAGIAADDLPHLFERFYRARPARASNPEGSGLGLAIVRSIMELHGGSAVIDSRPGVGTTVRLLFPAAAKITDR